MLRLAWYTADSIRKWIGPHVPRCFHGVITFCAKFGCSKSKDVAACHTSTQSFINVYYICGCVSVISLKENKKSVDLAIVGRVGLLNIKNDLRHWMMRQVRRNYVKRKSEKFCCFYRAMHFSAKRGVAIACRPSVCPSVTLVNCDHIGWNSSKSISPLVSLGCSLFATPTWRVCSKGNTP